MTIAAICAIAAIVTLLLASKTRVQKPGRVLQLSIVPPAGTFGLAGDFSGRKSDRFPGNGYIRTQLSLATIIKLVRIETTSWHRRCATTVLVSGQQMDCVFYTGKAKKDSATG